MVWEGKLVLDLEHIKNITFIIGCKIILKTLVKVFKRESISADGLDTTEDFGDYLLRLDKIKKSVLCCNREKQVVNKRLKVSVIIIKW